MQSARVLIKVQDPVESDIWYEQDMSHNQGYFMTNLCKTTSTLVNLEFVTVIIMDENDHYHETNAGWIDQALARKISQAKIRARCRNQNKFSLLALTSAFNCSNDGFRDWIRRSCVYDRLGGSIRHLNRAFTSITSQSGHRISFFHQFVKFTELTGGSHC